MNNIMGLGDEILALGRAEALYEQTGQPVCIVNDLGQPRNHEAWYGNPAWSMYGKFKIYDGNGCRPYIHHWRHRQAVYNPEYRARAGKIYLTPSEDDFCQVKEPFAVISPFVKPSASVNKQWSYERWEKVVSLLDIPVFQLLPDDRTPVLRNVTGVKTPHFKQALSFIKKAEFVMTNEGGSHHLAASEKKKAVVIFGSFCPPAVTGYDFHENIAVETDESHGFCGKWDYCPVCEKSLASITPDLVKYRIDKLRGFLP